MFFTNDITHALITIYGDPAGRMEKRVAAALDNRDYKILTPGDETTLCAAAENSVITIVGVHGHQDPHLRLGRVIRESRGAAGILIALCLTEDTMHPMAVMAQGFDACLQFEHTADPAFKSFLLQAIATGNRHLNSLIQEAEYRRVCDALSCAPASMIIFDPDKRVIFISDHYYRAYPRIAPRLIRGLSVYDAYDLMAREEGLQPDDLRYERLQKFWHNLEGSIEFTLDNGTTYRLKAAQLPSRGGTVVVGQNITDYHYREHLVERQLQETRTHLSQIEKDLKGNSHMVRMLAKELRAHLQRAEQVRGRKTGLEFSALEELINTIEQTFSEKH